MLVAVKKPPINFTMTGKIPSWILVILREHYGNNLEVQKDTVNVFETPWYKNIKKQMQPSENLKMYRTHRGWTQEELGEKLGGLPKQHISEMERNQRGISKNLAKLLANIFEVSVAKFI